jgi:hypothetical protein
VVEGSRCSDSQSLRASISSSSTNEAATKRPQNVFQGVPAHFMSEFVIAALKKPLRPILTFSKTKNFKIPFLEILDDF